jgi:L-seryl-tRNA(Ser) seleniumtransferase
MHGFPSVPTLAERIAEGADLVIADGAALIGGPACGVIVGRRKLIDLVAGHPLAALAEVDALASAALDATLDLYREAAAGPLLLQVPVWQQLSAPLDNLKQRAERLAPLMAESADVATAESRQVDSIWHRWGERAWTAPSWVIELRPTAGDGRRLRARLERQPYPVVWREADGVLWLDLRTVFPRWDQALAAAVTGSDS